MLESCTLFKQLFDVSDRMITRDTHPVAYAFWEGIKFQEALSYGIGDEGEVTNLDALYYEVDDCWDSNGYWRFSS